MFTVKEIHADFDTAQDRIVEEALRIISRPHKELTDKADRLAALGFNRSKDAVIGRQVSDNFKSQHELLNLMNAYKQKYPLNKFITDTEVEKLCKKYGLVFGDADRFIGEIPEKNLAEIESFKLLEEDMQEKISISSFGLISFPEFIFNSRGVLDIKRNPELEYTGTTKDSKSEPKKETFKPAFKIVATIQDFDTRDMTLKGHKLEQNLPDPIVLQPVKGGYLVVSKWGDEASDEIVLNEKMN